MFSGCRKTQHPCILTTDPSFLDEADLVIFSAYAIDQTKGPPPRSRSTQLWAFFNEETPVNTYFRSKPSYDVWNGLFNWTITYREDSDVVTAQGRIVLKNQTKPDDPTYTHKLKKPYLGSKNYSVSVCEHI